LSVHRQLSLPELGDLIIPVPHSFDVLLSSQCRLVRGASIGAGDAAQLRELAETLRAALRPNEKAENVKVLIAARALPYDDLRKLDLPDAFTPSWKDVGKRR